MKQLILIALFVTTIFANESFEKNKQYTCLNTHSMQQGQEVKANPKEAANRPFVFMIKEDKLLTTENVVFDFKMQRGEMLSYSNAQYMLLLTSNMQLGLVPRKARGSVQFYFQCK